MRERGASKSVCAGMFSKSVQVGADSLEVLTGQACYRFIGPLGSVDRVTKVPSPYPIQVPYKARFVDKGGSRVIHLT